jgi:phenylacetate-CoA ligase
MLALRGRINDTLPNGSHVGIYKDALYANPDLARHFTGATRLIFSSERFTMHVQLVQGSEPSAQVEQALLQQIPRTVRPSRLRSWTYRQFPFGMTLDYERKFRHHLVGEEAPESSRGTEHSAGGFNLRGPAFILEIIQRVDSC